MMCHTMCAKEYEKYGENPDPKPARASKDGSKACSFKKKLLFFYDLIDQ